MSIYDVFSGGNKPYDKEQWAAQKQAERKEAYELIDNTCSEMAVGGDSFRQYLDVQGRFDRYSVNNAILVSAQMPEAAQLKDKASWKQSRVYVNKDAQKITILEPSKEYTRDDGTKAVSYNAKVVYDISQTSAKDRQEAAEPKSMRELEMCIRDRYSCNNYARNGRSECSAHNIEARELFNAVLADINCFADMAVNDEKAVRAIETVSYTHLGKCRRAVSDMRCRSPPLHLDFLQFKNSDGRYLDVYKRQEL